jgi:hypothetical protein
VCTLVASTPIMILVAIPVTCKSITSLRTTKAQWLAATFALW